MYDIESNNDNIPEGIAASIIVTLYCKSDKPKNETNKNATNGKNINLKIDVKTIIDLLLDNPLKSIDNPN